MSNALVLVRSYTLDWFCFRLGLYRSIRFASRMCLAFWSIFVFASALVCFNFKSLYRFCVESAILSSARFLSENICLTYTRIIFCVHFFVGSAFGILGMFERSKAIELLITSSFRCMVSLLRAQDTMFVSIIYWLFVRMKIWHRGSGAECLDRILFLRFSPVQDFVFEQNRFCNILKN